MASKVCRLPPTAAPSSSPARLSGVANWCRRRSSPENTSWWWSVEVVSASRASPSSSSKPTSSTSMTRQLRVRIPAFPLAAALANPRVTQIRTGSSASLTTRSRSSTCSTRPAKKSTLRCASSTCAPARASCSSTPSHRARASRRSRPSSSKSSESRTRTASPWWLSGTSATWSTSGKCHITVGLHCTANPDALTPKC